MSDRLRTQYQAVQDKLDEILTLIPDTDDRRVADARTEEILEIVSRQREEIERLTQEVVELESEVNSLSVSSPFSHGQELLLQNLIERCERGSLTVTGHDATALGRDLSEVLTACRKSF